MRIARGGRWLRMAKKLADDRKSETCARANGCKRVSKIMDAYTFKPHGAAPRAKAFEDRSATDRRPRTAKVPRRAESFKRSAVTALITIVFLPVCCRKD